MINDVSADLIREYFSYDPDSGILYWKKNSKRARAGQPAGHLHRSENRFTVTFRYKSYRLHRIIWVLMTGEWPKTWIDHIDCDSSNNKWRNLREATPAENQHNSRMQKNNKAGFKGVFFDKRVCKFRAQIFSRGKKHYLGWFPTAEEASSAYKRAANRLNGDFARG